MSLGDLLAALIGGPPALYAGTRLVMLAVSHHQRREHARATRRSLDRYRDGDTPTLPLTPVPRPATTPPAPPAPAGMAWSGRDRPGWSDVDAVSPMAWTPAEDPLLGHTPGVSPDGPINGIDPIGQLPGWSVDPDRGGSQ